MVSTGLWTHGLNRGRQNSPDFTVHRPAKSVTFIKQWRILWTAHYSQMRLDGRINTGNETRDFSDRRVNNALLLSPRKASISEIRVIASLSSKHKQSESILIKKISIAICAPRRLTPRNEELSRIQWKGAPALLICFLFVLAHNNR